MQKKLLLTVEESFYLSSLGLGLVVLPEVSRAILEVTNNLINISIPVVLKYPDGKIKNMKAQFQSVHVNPGGFKILCSFGDKNKNEVPIGTEIWIE